MRIEQMHVGMRVRHPHYGMGEVKALEPKLATVVFPQGEHKLSPELSGLEPAEPLAEVSGVTRPLAAVIRETVQALAEELGLEREEGVVEGLGARWHGGRLVLHPADPALQTKEVPLEVFFHKIVMMRNNLRTLEQKINAHEKLTDGEKVELQQYITRCYGSMTTFNLLFKHKQDQFSGSSS
jgi:hypothetical protein